jgi:hypothetical protein
MMCDFGRKSLLMAACIQTAMLFWTPQLKAAAGPDV